MMMAKKATVLNLLIALKMGMVTKQNISINKICHIVKVVLNFFIFEFLNLIRAVDEGSLSKVQVAAVGMTAGMSPSTLEDSIAVWETRLENIV